MRCAGTGFAPCSREAHADACRDRLAAFYHWGDRQALNAAIQIACANRIGIQRIRAWSVAEGATARFEEFLVAVKAGRRR